MISLVVLMVYIPVAMLSYIAPGPDWLIISQNTFQSKKNGLASAIGVQSGLLFHMILSIIGAYAILLTSPYALNIVQLLGSIYIIWLGLSPLIKSHNKSSNNISDISIIENSIFNSYLNGFVVNLLNPKAAIFFLSILPQFVNREDAIIPQILVLGIVDIGVGLLWWLLFITAINKITSMAKDIHHQKKLETFTSIALIIIGFFFMFKSLLFFLI